MGKKCIKVGIIGFGTVGGGVAACLLGNRRVIREKTGLDLDVSWIGDIDIVKDRGVKVPRKLLTTDCDAVIRDSDIVVELVGGTTAAKDYMLKAMRMGKHVVTANKALLATAGDELFDAAGRYKVDLYFEASVGGGIPIIKALREGFAADRITEIKGILNGTCNYILTRMEKEKLPFDEILRDAQRLGYAEADPTFDIDGIDTAHKTAILASLGFGGWLGMDPIHIEGIRGVTLKDVMLSGKAGYRIKLLSVIKEIDGSLEARVSPALVDRSTILADVLDVFNGICIDGIPIGRTMFYGRGAGRQATSSAVVADIIDIGLNMTFGARRRIFSYRRKRLYSKVLRFSETSSRYYVRVTADRPAEAMGEIEAVFTANSIKVDRILRDRNDIVFLTAASKEKKISRAFSRISGLRCIKDSAKIRIEEF